MNCYDIMHDINEKLYYYVERRDLKAVNKLLAEGANATKVTSFGRSAVGQATCSGFPEILEVLLKSCEEEYISFSGSIAKKPRTDSDIEKTPDGMDGLQWDDEIHQSTSYSSDDEWSRLYMYYARIFDQTGELLANTVKLKDPHCLDAYHQAPIHYAASFGHVDCLDILLQHGSPVDIPTHSGKTPLHLGTKNKEIVQKLLQFKSDPNLKEYTTGETPLHVAARIGNLSVVERLVEYGANINSTNDYNRSPLMIAITHYNIDVANFLIGKKAKLNLQDLDGYTALYFCVVINNSQLTLRLLENGARPLVAQFLIHYCVRNNYLEMLKLLIKFGENINVRDIAGCTPLFWAIKQCSENMVEFLLQNGAQRFERDDNVVKELHLAVQHAETVEQFKKVARVLLANGISIDDYNYWCETPVMMAIMLEKYKIAEFLIKEGADVNKGRNENIVDNFLLVRRTSNLNLLILLVNSGLKLNPMPSNLKPPPWNDINTDLEDWLAFTCKTPLSLQKLCRISIRNSLIKTSRTKLVNAKSNESCLEVLIRQTELPDPLQKFLYEFNDLPNI